MQSLKEIGYKNEDLVQRYYENLGFTCLKNNFTIRGGEIDLLCVKDHSLVVVEVKTVNQIEDFSEYITHHKIKALERTLKMYLQKSQEEYDEYSIDVVFVKDGKIIDHYENITNG